MNEHFSTEDVDKQRLSFIKSFQELLDRKPKSESEDTHSVTTKCKDLQTDICNICEKIKLLGLQFSEVYDCEKQIDLLLRQYIEQRKKPWLQDNLTIAFMGPLKTGKTSAINCYFGENFPISSEEATALATYLYYGENPDCMSLLIDKDGGALEIDQEQMKLFSIENSFNFPFARMYSHIAKKSDHPSLVDMTFVDTPGLFSSNSEHAHTTNSALDYCDVIFWFVDTRKSISEKDLDFITEHIQNKDKDKHKPIYIIFSFVDKIGTTESGIKKGQEVIKKMLVDEKVTVQGFLQFGEREATQDRFKRDLRNVINSLRKMYKSENPLLRIEKILAALQKSVLSEIKRLNKRKNKKNEQYRNSQILIQQRRQAVCDALNSVRGRFNNVQRFVRDRCGGIRFCSTTVDDLKGNNRQLLSSVVKAIEEWNNLNFETIEHCGSLLSEQKQLENQVKQLDAINTDINKILNQFKSWMKLNTIRG